MSPIAVNIPNIGTVHFPDELDLQEIGRKVRTFYMRSNTKEGIAPVVKNPLPSCEPELRSTSPHGRRDPSAPV
jgi:hypothetical protein